MNDKEKRKLLLYITLLEIQKRATEKAVGGDISSAVSGFSVPNHTEEISQLSLRTKLRIKGIF